MSNSSRIGQFPPYIFNITNELKIAAQKRGEYIIDLSMGNPDQGTSKHIIKKLIEASLDVKNHGYSPSIGILSLRRAICSWYKRRYSVKLDPDSEAIVTIGAKEGLAHLMQASLNSEDIVLVPNPSYPIHIYGALLAGASVQYFRMDSSIDLFEELRSSIFKSVIKPRMIVLGFPSNPTAQCVDLAFFEQLVNLARKYNILLVHDLTYADITFDGYIAPSIMQVQNATDVAVEFFSMSKSYNMAGWRIGYMVGNAELVRVLAHIKSYHDYGCFAPIQLASVVALEGPQDCVQRTVEQYQIRRDILVKELHKIGWNVETPRASMYIWAKIPDPYVHMGSLNFSKYMLENARVAVSPGIGFGEYGDGYIRFALVKNEPLIFQAVEGIRDMFRRDGLIK